MKNPLFLITFLFLSLYSCNNSNVKTISFTRVDFPKTYNLTNPTKIELNYSDSISMPVAFWVIRDSIVIVQNNTYDKSAIDLYSLENNSFRFHVAPRGRGPGEFINANFTINYNNKDVFYLDDGINRYTINIDSTLNKRKAHITNFFSYYRENNHTLIPVNILNEKEYLSYNLWYINEDGYSNNIPPFTKYNMDTKESTGNMKNNNFKYFPGSVNGAFIFSNRNNGEIWLADLHKDEICIYNSSLKHLKTISGPDHLTPRFTLTKTPELSMLTFANNQDFRTYLSYVLTDDYVYIIYQGIIGVDYDELQLMNLPPSEIFKFTWKGELAANYKLDKYARTISIPENGKCLYITSLQDYGASPVLYRYEL